MAFLITMLIVFFLVVVICIFLVKETNGNSILVALAFIVIGWIMVQAKTTKIAEPTEVPMTELSIMIDDEVAIIRYGDVMKTYDNVRQYKAIKDSSFSFMEIKEYNVLGDDNGSTFELNINN